MEVALFWPPILFVIVIVFLLLFLLILVLNEMVLVLENTSCEYECEYVFARVSTPQLTAKRISKDASTTMH